jgi:hypothetical protein
MEELEQEQKQIAKSRAELKFLKNAIRVGCLGSPRYKTDHEKQ